MSERETITEFIELYPHIDFNINFNEHLFNTNPDYYNANSTAESIVYKIQYSAADVQIGTNTAIIQIDTDNNINRTLIANNITGPDNNESDILAGTLPQIMQVKEDFVAVRENFKVQTPNANTIYLNQPKDISIKLQNVNEYFNAHQIVTRNDSSTDLVELLFVSNGTLCSMTNDTFIRETQRYITPEFYEENVNTGWGITLVDSDKVDYLVLDNVQEYIDENIPGEGWQRRRYRIEYTTPAAADVAPAIQNQFTHYYTKLPEISWSPPVTYADGSTSSDYLIMSFESTTTLAFTSEDVEAMDNPFLLLFKHNEEKELTHLIAYNELVDFATYELDGEPAELISLSIKLKIGINDLLII